jgi:transposase-like protein
MGEKPYHNPDWLNEQYYNQNRTLADIADDFNISPAAVSYWMRKHGINPGNSVQYARFETKTDGYEHWESGRQTRDGSHDRVYVHQLLAIADGADPHELFGGQKQIHHANSIPWDNRPANLQVMTTAGHAEEHQQEQWGDAPWRDEDAVRDGLEDYSVSALADEFGCSNGTLRDWLRRHGIPPLSPGRKPDKHESTDRTERQAENQ